MTVKPRWLTGLGETADAVFVVDSSRKILLWNTAAEQLLGYAAEEVLGLRCCDTLAGRTCSGNAWCHAYCPVQRAVSRGATQKNFDLILRAKDGSEVCANISIIAVPYRDKHLTAHIARPMECHDRYRETLSRIRDLLRDSGSPNGTAVHPHGGDGSGPARLGSLTRLTSREIEILSLVAEGFPNAAIASRLCISSYTVRNHVQNILDKLGLHSKAEAVGFAFKRHLLQ